MFSTHTIPGYGDQIFQTPIREKNTWKKSIVACAIFWVLW